MQSHAGCNPNARRLQEAGYRDLLELQALGQPEPEVWPSSRLIKKLRTKLSLSGGLVLLHYRERTLALSLTLAYP